MEWLPLVVCCLPGPGVIRAGKYWPSVCIPDKKRKLMAVGFGLVGLHIKGILEGKLFTVSKIG